MIEVALIALLGLPGIGALVIWLGRLQRLAGPLTVLLSLTMAALALIIAGIVERRGPQYALNDWVYVDQLSVIVLTLISIVGVCAALNSQSYLTHDLASGELEPADMPHYYGLFLAFMATMVAVPLMNNLGLMWVAIEATTIFSVLLISLYRTGRALEAAWKYLVLGSVGIALALFGTMMAFYAVGDTLGESAHALNWTVLRAATDRIDPEVMRVAFIFILVGYGTKIGLAPMHTWLPDAHSQAPSPVSGLLSGVLLNCALYAVLRFRILTIGAVGDGYVDQLLIGFGLFSIALAVPFILVQHDIKRMLGYSSVEHMGIIALAIGIGGPAALYAAMLHLVAHSLTKSSLFFASGYVVQGFRSRSMNRMRGVMKLMPLPGLVLLFGAASLSGLPPFAIFTSEYGLVLGAFSSRQAVVGVAGVLLMTLAAASLLYHVMTLAYREPRLNAQPGSVSLSFALSVVTPIGLLLWLSLAPPAGFESTLHKAVEILEAQ